MNILFLFKWPPNCVNHRTYNEEIFGVYWKHIMILFSNHYMLGGAGNKSNINQN